MNSLEISFVFFNSKATGFKYALKVILYDNLYYAPIWTQLPHASFHSLEYPKLILH